MPRGDHCTSAWMRMYPERECSSIGDLNSEVGTFAERPLHWIRQGRDGEMEREEHV